MKTEMPRPIRLKDYRPSDYLVDKVDLDFSLHPTATTVRSRMRLRPNPDVANRSRVLRLNGEQLSLQRIRLDGKVLKEGGYSVTDSELIVPGVPDGPFRLDITTVINPEANTALSGLYRSKGIYCTQCEAEGFRRITYFLDRPDILATYRTRIEADIDQAATLLSNGNPVERGTLEGGKRHYAVWRDPFPKPSYLFALVGGNLASIASTYRTTSGRSVDLRIYVEPGKESRCGWAMDSLKRSMAWDERRFDREYDLDVFNIVAVSDFNMGAMENKGLNIFNDRLILASPETATDFIYTAIESVVAHEYFHNWTGNRITCRDWFQLCLKEGLTVFRDQEFTADERDRTVERIGSVRQLRANQFPEDMGPLAHPVRPASYIEINNFYTATVYEKGAELVRMILTICGADGFRSGMQLYFDRHDGDAATIEDFLACFEEANGLSLKQFKIWYRQAGTPQLVCKFEYDAKRQTAELIVDQVLPPTPGEAKKRALHIPLKMGLLGPDGKDTPLQLSNGDDVRDGVLHVTRRNQKFRFVNVPQRPVPSFLRGFSAPVVLVADQSDRDLAYLMTHDTDLFSRWQATVDYASRILVQLSKAREPKKYVDRVNSYASALVHALMDERLNAAYRAELMRLPSESDIAREVARNVDPDAIHDARSLFAKTLSHRIGSELEHIYEATEDHADFSPDAASAGRRALRNAALTLLTARGKANDKARLVAHFDRADNMTDEAHALYLLSAYGGSARQPALDAFFARWQDDHLVIDTWFAVQATAPAKGTLGRVKKLLRHDQFSLKTPNKVRALIGSFAMQNPSQFNRSDGLGYDFVAKQVLALDRINPQIAARMLNAFRSWRSMDPSRRGRAKAALVKISRNVGLSRDVYEIASKMIDDEK
ncbi:MAG: aminopeptidase N [Hyphomicrobiaceae bacterium]